MRILSLDSAGPGCSATLVTDGQVVTELRQKAERGQAALLTTMARDCLADAGLQATQLDLVAVTVGPGSFTGIRGGIALAQGIALAAGIEVIGVTVGEALADSLPQLGGRQLWVASTSRKDRVFLEIDGQRLSVATTDLPMPRQPLAIAGTAAPDIASRLAARGVNVMLTDARLPMGRHIALVAEQRFRGDIAPLPAEPLYIDPPEAKHGP